MKSAELSAPHHPLVRLDKLLAGSGVFLMPGLRIAGRAGRIDCVAVGPAGVTVIKTATHAGRVQVRDRRLFAGAADRTDVIDRVRQQKEIVASVLGGRHRVPIHGAVCWAQSDALPRYSRVELDGVLVGGIRHLAQELRRAGGIDASRSEALRRRIMDAVLPGT